MFDSYIVHHHCTYIVCCSISNSYSTNFHVSVFLLILVSYWWIRSWKTKHWYYLLGVTCRLLIYEVLILLCWGLIQWCVGCDLCKHTYAASKQCWSFGVLSHKPSCTNIVGLFKIMCSYLRFSAICRSVISWVIKIFLGLI